MSPLSVLPTFRACYYAGNREQVQSPAHNLNVSHQSGKNSFQKNLLFIAEDHTRLKARRRESQFFLPFLLASCLTSLLSLRSYVHKHKPEIIFSIQFLPLILSLFRY